MKTKANKPAKSNIAKMAIVGVLSAIAYLLMFMEFSVPLMPVFIKMDLSDFPALIGSLAVGPAGGIIIALIKNLLHHHRCPDGTERQTWPLCYGTDAGITDQCQPYGCKRIYICGTGR